MYRKTCSIVTVYLILSTTSIAFGQEVNSSVKPIVYKTPLNDTGAVYAVSDRVGSKIPVLCEGKWAKLLDCHSGRDAKYNNNDDGIAGFSFTKIDSNGNKLDVEASSWDCVQDNITGLVWETKVGGNSIIGDEGLRDSDDKLYWFHDLPKITGGPQGVGYDGGKVNRFAKPNICSGYTAGEPSTYCNILAYKNRINNTSLCGIDNWRIPTRHELVNISVLGVLGHYLDPSYFNVTRGEFWPIDTFPGGPFIGQEAFTVSGLHIGKKNKKTGLKVRLVSGK